MANIYDICEYFGKRKFYQQRLPEVYLRLRELSKVVTVFVFIHPEEINVKLQYLPLYKLNFVFMFFFKYCVVLYNFEALDESTLVVSEGEVLRIIQKHDDNKNDEWWLLERGDEKTRGYVPSNYVELIRDKSTFAKRHAETRTPHQNDALHDDSSFGNESQTTNEYGSAVI